MFGQTTVKLKEHLVATSAMHIVSSYSMYVVRARCENPDMAINYEQLFDTKSKQNNNEQWTMNNETMSPESSNIPPKIMQSDAKLTLVDLVNNIG